MPEEHDERAGYGARDDFDELDDFDDDEFDNDDEPDDDDDDGPGRHWPAPGFPPGSPGDPPGGWAGARRYIAGGWGGGAAGRGRLLALTAVVAAAFGFGVVVVALHEGAGPASAGAAPGSGASPGTGASGAGNGTQPAPRGGGPQSLPPGAMERLEIGGQVMAVSATSITLNGGGQAITAAVTQSTTVTGKVTTIRGVKVGDFVSATLSGTNGKLTADSIQDPASLPAAPRQ